MKEINMKEIGFYKYFENENEQKHFWEGNGFPTNLTKEKANDVSYKIKEVFPNSIVNVFETFANSNAWGINVKFHSNEDNGHFCLFIND